MNPKLTTSNYFYRALEEKVTVFTLKSLAGGKRINTMGTHWRRLPTR